MPRDNQMVRIVIMIIITYHIKKEYTKPEKKKDFVFTIGTKTNGMYLTIKVFTRRSIRAQNNGTKRIGVKYSIKINQKKVKKNIMKMAYL